MSGKSQENRTIGGVLTSVAELMRRTALFTSLTYLTFSLLPPPALAALQAAPPPTAGWHLLPATSTQQTAISTIFGSLSPTAVKRYDSATSSLQTATQAEPGQAYWVQLSTSKTWTPPLPKDVTTQMVYDGDGGKVKQTTASGTTTYLGEAYEKDPTGNPVTRTNFPLPPTP